MTPNYLNSTQNSTFFVGSLNIEDRDRLQFHHQQFFSPSFERQHDASSSSHSFQFYLNNSIQDQAGYNYHTELVNQPPQQPIGQVNESVVAFDPDHQVENKVEKGLKVSFVSNKEGKHEIVGDQEANKSAKWMSSKVRMKKSDPRKGGEKQDFNNNNNNNNDKFLGSNNDDDESNCSTYNNNSNTPIRVCVDCNTTKTPLWRSGPKGPKSLCNACGIRQRKARRALAAAAAAATIATPLSSSIQTPTITKLKIKVNQQKEKSKNNYGINGLSNVPFKKRCKLTSTNTSNASLAVGSSSSDDNQEPKPANKFEVFLIDMRNKLDFNDHVFPPDEEEAAILLMALSSGLVHG